MTPALSTVLDHTADALEARAECGDGIGPRELLELARCMHLWAERARAQETPQALRAALAAEAMLRQMGIDTATA